MDIDRTLDELGRFGDALPVAAIRAASEHRDLVVPRILDRLEQYVQGTDRSDLAGDSLFIAFHLLGEWRATAAYRPLLRFLALPDDVLWPVFGDGSVDTGHRIIAAVFDGDPQPLYELILDPEADEFIRARMYVLAMLVVRGQLPRDEAARFLRDSFDALQRHDERFVLGRMAKPLPRSPCRNWCRW